MNRRRQRRASFDLNLDPLMDVVTNAVGIMLFVVIFAVIAARSTSVSRVTPLLSKPREHQERVFYLCADGRVRRFDWDGAFATVDRMAKGLTYARIPKLVSRFNEENVEDEHFSYRLEFETEQRGFTQSRKVFLVTTERGDHRTNQANDLSALERELASSDAAGQWLSFLVDESSIRAFLDARDLAAEKGFAIGWDPGRIEFPFRQCILGCGSGSGQGGFGTGPQSGGLG